MSYRDEDDPFEEDIVFDQAGLLSTSRKSSKSAIRRVSSGKCAMFSKTLGLCGAFLGLGLTFAIPGPLSPVPPGELSHDKSLMTYEVMYRCQGFMIGAMFGARLLDRFNRLFLVFLALLVTALLVTIIPWCGNVWLLRTDMFLLGVSLGFLSTGGNVLCLDLWGRNSGPFMQALHFSFSLGVFLAPFLSQPLMTPVNYALVSPTTTPASMFPLHRLPRDVGSISSNATSFVAADASLLHASSPPYHDSAFNKSATNASYSSSTSVPFSTPATKTSVPELNGMLLMAPASSSALNFSESKVTASSIAATSMTFAARPHIEAVNSSSSLGQPSNASTDSPGSIPVPAVASVAASPPKVDVSTTTHRSPRPKPVLTNSEKLKDNKWENEKFRKPPPEDLVPVSTTMKPMVKVGNKTTVASNMTYSSTPSLLSIGSYSTVKPSVLTNSMKPANVSKLSLILNGSTGPNSTVISSPAPSKTPLIDASSTLSSISKISPAGSIPLKINASLVSNTSEAVSSSVHMKINETHHITDTGIVPVSPWTPDKAPIQGLQVKGNAANHSTPAPITLEAILSTSSSAAKQGDALLSTHSVVSKVLKDTPSLSTGKSTINNKSGSSPRSGFSDSLSSASSAGKEKLSSSQSSAEVSLPVIVNPKSVNNSQYMGKSISLDEQDSAQSGLSSSTSQQPPARMSTHQPQKISKLGEHEKTSSVNQKSFGGGHVKAMMEAKPVQVTTESTGLPSSKDFKVPEGKTKVIPTASPFLVKNIPAVVETINHPESPAGPKHVHHSKPASTVVNDTAEVTHTVIDDVANRLEKYGLSRMELMYLTVGMILLATSFLFLGFLCFNPRDPKSKTEEEDMNGHVGRAGQRGRLGSGQSAVVPSRCLRHTLIGLMMVLLMITSGVQAMYGQLLMVYALQAPLQLSQSTGTALTATFWGALTSTRFACILLASALSPTAMLVLSVAICSCATWLLSAFASSSEVALWIGSVMVSVGTASVIPSGMLWMQRHVLVTHRVAAMLVMGPAMGEMFFPTLAYKMMVSLGPASLVHLPALLSLFAIAVWAAEWRLARYPRQPSCSHGDESSGYQLANQHDEDDLLDLTMSPIVNGTTAVLRSHSRSNGNGLGVHRMSA